MKAMDTTMNDAVLITAAGSSERFGEKKEYLPLNDDADPHTADSYPTVLSASLSAFVATGFFRYYAITVPQNDIEKVYSLLAADKELRTFLHTHRDQLIIVEGGASRQASVYRGLRKLAEISKDIGHVLVHDGARPWISGNLIAAIMETTKKYGAAVPAIPVTDTQKEVDDTGKIIRHLRRDRLAAIQTPQGFPFAQLLAAHRCAEYDGIVYTDDSEIYAKYCGAVYTCPGSRKNKKITYQEDFIE